MYLLGYDIGSSSVKASLVNAESGKCVSVSYTHLDVYKRQATHCPQPTHLA